ncbi:MAG: hypothetical protein MZW92_77315 [Comamonadaceae bacterium]|nr:hypothetical protein [Comamonadaceae bacterium]
MLYKLGDAFAGCADDALPAQEHGLHPAEVGVVNKVIGLWLTIGGALLGGALMLAHRPVARAAALRRAADWSATWASGGWRSAGKGVHAGRSCCRPSTGASSRWPRRRRWTAGC